MKEDQARALDKLQRYAAQYGDLSARPTALTGSLPDRTLIAGVANVRYDSNRTLVEIDAGSRDGVKMDWQMTIGEGADFIARIRIIEVDINRSVGVVDLERGSIQIGQRVYAVAPN
jgi:cell shape-determining protein MreC